MPYRVPGDGLVTSVEILLVTSRGTGRWVMPKGNRGKREAAHLAAAREALEEAGVTGTVHPEPIGAYFYSKITRSGAAVRTQVRVFPLAVTAELPEWAESGERTRGWFSLHEAAQLVDEADLGSLILGFAIP